MNLCILDGAPAEDPVAGPVRRAILDRAASKGWTPNILFLPDMVIADCAGDFNCWLKTPGVCSINDANRDVARGIAQADLLVFLTPVTFGGYSSELKKGLDHIVQVVSPFFESVDGETRHQTRYERHPTLVGIGLMDRFDEESARIFRTVVARNAANLRNAHHASSVLHLGLGTDGIAAEAGRLLDGTDGVPHDASLDIGPRAAEWGTAHPAPKQALLLVGSPRGLRSTSASLGQYMTARLREAGVGADVMEIYAAQRSPEQTSRLVEASDSADLLVLSFPLYADSLPAAVIRLLERLAAHRRESDPSTRRPSQHLAAIVQCGFPETRHNHTALAICRQFARESGFIWAGGLPLGGGHGIVQSKPLEALGGRGAHIRKALDLSARALAGGNAIPGAAVEGISRPVMPSWLYRLVGNLSWRVEARRLHTSARLRNRPYEPRP